MTLIYITKLISYLTKRGYKTCYVQMNFCEKKNKLRMVKLFYTKHG